ncbi:MAG TPA: hypothetical protein DIT54_06230 [Lachnospiraceae bacterium]|jgi:predicted transcriptional regulator|nr:hypothetical protein [Lachnospiraceae bacterium]
MNQEFKRLSKTELEFMKVIWDNPDGILSESIFQNFKQARTTQSNVLRTLVQKGCAEVVKEGLHTRYFPKLSQEEYEELLSKQKVGKLEGIILSFFQKKKLNDKEIDEVKEFLEQLKDE